MNSDIIIGLLALFTIGGILALAIFHFGYHLRDPRNKEAAHRTLIRDEGSAAIDVRDGNHDRPTWMRKPSEVAEVEPASTAARTTVEGNPMSTPARTNLRPNT